MKKKAIALAIGAALGAPSAFAQTVQVYGKVYPQIMTLKGSGGSAAADYNPAESLQPAADGTSANKGRTGIAANNSRVGFRGSEDLGAGMKAIFQIETAVNVDDGTAGTWGTRDSFVGLEGGFGTLRFGKMDTPYKNYGDTLSFLGVSSGNFVSTGDLMRKFGFGSNSSSNSAHFHLRRNNAVDYESPKMGGFTVGVQWSSDELFTNAGGEKVPTFLSGGVNYEVGPLYLAVAHEIHTDAFAGSRNSPAAFNNRTTLGASSKDTATQFTVKYRFGIHTVEVDFNQKTLSETTPGAGQRFKEYKNTAFSVGAEQRWSGQWRTQFNYVKANAGSCSFSNGATCDTSGLDGTQISVGVANYLSKRTYVFALYAQVTNGKSATYDNTSFGPGPNPGEDIRQMAIGVAHSF